MDNQNIQQWPCQWMDKTLRWQDGVGGEESYKRGLSHHCQLIAGQD
jgi:hypothetical protein